jgi:hypothetical protein
VLLRDDLVVDTWSIVVRLQMVALLLRGGIVMVLVLLRWLLLLVRADRVLVRLWQARVEHLDATVLRGGLLRRVSR